MRNYETNYKLGKDIYNIIHQELIKTNSIIIEKSEWLVGDNIIKLFDANGKIYLKDGGHILIYAYFNTKKDSNFYVDIYTHNQELKESIINSINNYIVRFKCNKWEIT